MIEGGCLCGALRYEVASPLGALTHCHCTTCRKHHGAPFATFVTVPMNAFRWIEGESSLVTYASSRGRVRRSCGACGAVAPTAVDGGMRVPAGNLRGELGEIDARHAFVGSKAPWHVIADGLPQHDGAPPGWSANEAPLPPSDVPARGHADEEVRGSCACGEVTFTVTGAPGRWLQCHCSRCRRGRSAAHGSNTFYPTPQFAWRTGQGSVRSYSPPDAARFTLAFCERCGGGAPVERDNVPFVLVPAALFDRDPGARPQAHIHVASKAPWYVFGDGLPQFAELPT